MKKILIVANLYPSEIDPTYGTFVKNFADELELFFPFIRIDKCVIKGRATSLLNKLWKYCGFYSKVFLNLLLNDYDVVYVHYISHSVPPIKLASIIKRIPIAFNIHGDDLLVKNKRGKMLLWLAAHLLCESKMVIVPSTFFQKVLKETIPAIPSSNIYVSPSGGIKDSFYFPQNKDKEVMGKLCLGYVSRIDIGKGWDVFVKAVKIIKTKGYGINAVMIGNGTQINELKDMIDSLDLNVEINYIGGIPHEKLPLYYKEFDLFVFPTALSESLGLVGIEAMACCTPVIGSDCGGIKSYLIDNENGFRFKAGDEMDLVNKIIEYINLPNSMKNRMRENSYKTAEKYRSSLVSKELFNKLAKVYNLSS